MSEIIERSFRGEWIENIPDDWKQSKIKHLFAITKNIAGELGHSVLSITQRGAKIKDTESGGGQLSMDYSKYQLVETGNFLMNHMDLLTGYVDISKYDGVTSPDYRVFKIKNTLSFPQYFLYVFQHCYKSKIFYAYGCGSSQLGRWRLPTVEFENFYLPLPPIEEQKLISRYLDKKTEQIDRLVKKTQKKIELLKEQRKSMIKQCVTKGLDPNVEMKDSGVEWIGEVPKHWKVSKFKYFFEFGMGQTILKEELSESGFPVLSATEKYKIFGFYKDPRLVLNVGDLVIPARGNSIGYVKLVREPSTSTQTTIYGKLTNKVDTRYVKNYCEGYKNHLFQFERTAIPQITVEQVKGNIVLIPPLTEQRSISEKVTQFTTRNNELVNKLNKKINKLTEYRQSLILSAVNGKVRVTEDMV